MIALNSPIEVNQKQYAAVRNELCGVCAHREDNGRYYIMLWWGIYRSYLAQLLKSNA